MSTSVGDVFLDLRLNKKPFERGMSETKASAGVAGSRIGKAIAGGIAAAMGAISFASLINKTVQVGDAIDKMSQKMGMSSASYQEWNYVMERSGANMDSMTTAMKTLASSAETSKDALAQLGISQAEVASMSQEQLFARVIEQLQGVEDTTRRTYLAGQLLGRGATELGAVLNMSAQDTANLRANLYSLGGVMSQTAVTNSAQLADAFTDMKMAGRSFMNTIAESILPIVTRAINGFIIPAIQRAAAILQYFVNIWASVFGAVKKRAAGIAGMFGTVGERIKSAFGKKTTKPMTAAASSIGGVGKSIGGTGKAAKKAKKAVKELTREVMGFDRINKLASKNKDKAADASPAGGGTGGAGGAGGVGGVGEALGDVNNKTSRFAKLAAKLKPLWKALGDIFKAVLRLIKALIKAFAPIAKAIWEHLIKPFGKLLGMAIIAVLEGIAGAIELLAIFVEKHPKLGATLATIFGAFLLVKNAYKVGQFVGLFARGFAKLAKPLIKVGKFLFAHPFIAILAGIAIAIGYIYKNWDKIKKTKFGKFLIATGKLLKKIGEYIGGKFKKAFDTVSGVVGKFKDAWSGIKDKAVTIKAKAAEGLDNLFEGVSDIAVEIKAKVATKWDDIKGSWNAITSNIKDKTASMKAAVASKWADFKTKWGNLLDNFKGKTASIKASIASKWADFKTKWNNLLGKFKGKVVKIGLKFSAAAKDLKGWINRNVINKINSKFKKVPILKNHLIPPLAEGGWVPKNTPQLAMIGDNRHESEIVAPDSKLAAMARQAAHEAAGAGNNAQVVALLTQILAAVLGIDTSVYLDGRDITKSVIKNINQQTRTTGKFPLIV